MVQGNGLRPHVVANMTIKEFTNPTDTKEGSQVVAILNHKTLHLHGPAHLIFTMKNLYAACQKYRDAFR